MIEHGGDLARAIKAYGIERARWLDLSTGVNPNGYDIEGLPQACFHRLPEPQDIQALEMTAREAYGVRDASAVIAAPGSEFLINALPQIRPHASVAILSPTFSTHEAAWRRYGHRVRTIDSIDSVENETVVVMVNPNNPDGMITSPSRFKRLASDLESSSGLLVIDEAFVDTIPERSFVPHHDFPNVIVLRSIGKFYGVAGVRLGFAIGPTRILDGFRTILGAWGVSGPAIEVGRRVLEDQDWAETMRAVLNKQSDQHIKMFETLGMKRIGGTSLFHLIENSQARTLHIELAKRGIWTRVFEYNQNWMRVGLCRTQQDLKRFQTALGEVQTQIGVAA